MQYFFEYVLRIRGEPGKKANWGTVLHKCMEILALSKKSHQDNPSDEIVIKEETIGQIVFNPKNWAKKEEYLKYKIADRKSVDELFSLVYSYYNNLYSSQEWTDEERKAIKTWLYEVLSFQDGTYDPRFQKIIQPEQKLSVIINDEWGVFDHDGVKGQLTLNGVIDLIVDAGNGIWNVIDYKSGARKDWAKGGKVKTFEDMKHDLQLEFYYYLLNRLFPQIEHFMLTIYYVNDGGPFTIPFDKSQLPAIEKRIASYFHKIRDMEVPKMIDPYHKSFKCRKLCPHLSVCQDTHSMIKAKGVDIVTNQLRRK